MSTGRRDVGGPALSARLTDVGGALLERRPDKAESMLAFIGGGPWLFDHLADLGVSGIAFGEGVTTRANGNVIAVEMPMDEARFEESTEAVEWIDRITFGWPIRRFVSINEIGTYPAALLNEQRGLGGVPPTAVMAARDKAEMRRRLEGTPLAWPYFVCQNCDVAPQAIAEVVGLPCVAKPRNLTGSKGVRFLKDLDELARYIANAKAKTLLPKIMFERCIEGEEYSLEAFTLNGHTKIYSITQKNNIGAVEFDFGFSREFANRHGSACQEALELLLGYLEIQNGPNHTEVKIGPDGNVRVIETHARIGGGYIPEMVRVITGVDLYALTVQEACGALHSLPEPQDRQIAAALKYKRFETGKVISLRGEHNLRFRPDVLAYVVKSRPGVKVRAAESNFDRADFVACHAPTLGEAYARCDHYLDSLFVTTS